MPHTALTRKTTTPLTKYIIFFMGIIALNGLTWLHPPDTHASHHSFGPLTEYGSRLKQHIQTDKDFPAPLTYINALSPPLPEEWQTIHQQLTSGAIIIVDGTTSLPADVQDISAKVGGLGMRGTIVMIRKQPGKAPEYKDLQWFPPQSETDGETVKINHQLAQKLADETLQMLTPWHSSSRYRTAVKPGGKVPPWKPELSIPIEIRQLGFPCLVGSRYEGNNFTGYSAWDDTLIDACNNEASVSLNYSVELIRSKRSKGTTQNAKIVRITMDPGSSGGAGWHLVNLPQHKHTWFESWANRETWYGPVAESYAVTLEPLDPDIRLYHAVPDNHPKHSEISHTTKIEIGVALTAGIDFPLHDDQNEGQQMCCGGNDEHGHDADIVDGGAEGDDDGAHPAHAHGGQPPAAPQAAGMAGNDSGPCCCGGHGSSSDSGGHGSSSDSVSHGSSTDSGSHDSSSDTDDQGSTGMDPMSDDDEDDEGADQHKNSFDPYGHESGGSCCRDDVITFPGTGGIVRSTLFPSTLQKRQHTLSPHRQKRTRAAQFRDIGTEQSFTYESKRSIAYQNHEYEVINRAKTGIQNTASWLWTREFSKYASHWRTNNTCPLWCDDWFFADSAFSPAAYAHFIPGFSATFMVPAEKTGQSTIRFTSSVKPIALGGRVQYQFFYQKYAPFSRKGTDYHLAQDLTIDWDSPIFAAEIPISLEALHRNTPNGACLTAHSTNRESLEPASVSSCQLQPNQLWGLDTELRLRSFLIYDHCLNREPDDTLSLRRCDRSISQKWKWVENNLVNRQGGYLSISSEGSLYTSWQPAELTAWHGFIRQSHSSDALRVDPAVKT
ncbi:leukocidin family pore-forming toxin [Kistimonas asteriae]|uniref:leukocidin family pore-forming toxin n=1 Tax=Kistimonas asteriae TaxID=517724 RepID=UPI001BAC9EAE|nr:leukocidin family pore-forming toxin [Kistimonas asteriae]